PLRNLHGRPTRPARDANRTCTLLDETSHCGSQAAARGENMNVFCRQTESKRTRRLTAGLTAALVAAVISSALASVPLGVRDDFDYTDTRARTTGVELDYVAGQLVFHLGTDSTALPVVAVGDNPRFAAGEVPDDEFLADTLPGVTLEVRAGTLYS